MSTGTVLVAVENKTPYQSKRITTAEVNKLTAKKFAARLARANKPSKSSMNSLTNGVAKIISYLDPYETQDHDILSTQSIKLCCNLIYEPLNEDKFPHECEKPNVEPVR